MRPDPRRWLVLAAYTAVVAVSQLLWLNFAPILTQIQARYGVGELEASALVLVFPLLYVVLSIPARRLVDTRLLLVFAMAFLGLGVLNGLTTWLERILAPQGFDSEQAGTVGGVLIAGGIAGSVVIPLLSDRFRRRRPAAALVLAFLVPETARPARAAVAAR